MKSLKFKGKTIKIMLISIIVLIVFFSIGSMIFIKMTYERSFSRVDKPDRKYSGFLRYSDLDEYEQTEVEFKSGKNILKGYIYGGENNKGLVVISHGLGFGSESYLSETIYFVDKGWSVFAYDNTGTHESEGESTLGPSQSLLDLNNALTYIENNDNLKDLQVMLYGHSWGAYAVTAILDYNHDIAAVASIAGFNSPMELLKEQSDRLLGPFSPTQYPFIWLYQNMLFGNTSRFTATEAINNSDTPVMIIHGDKDEVISYGGASIISHRDEISNPNVIYKTFSAENHNGHNNLFESDQARAYTKVKNIEYKEIYDKYNGEIPDEVRAKYYEGVDRFLTGDLDKIFMDEINLFFEMQLP